MNNCIDLRIKSPEPILNNCFEAVFAGIAAWKNRHYELMYLNEWEFKFKLREKQSKNRLGNSLDTFISLSDPLYLYHGIRFLQYQCFDKEELLDILYHQLLNAPVTVKT